MTTLPEPMDFEARAVALSIALDLLADYIDADEEDQTSGETEGIYDEADADRLADMEASREKLARAKAAVALLTAPRVVGIVLEGGVVQDVWTPDPAGLSYVLIDYDTDEMDDDDDQRAAARQDDGTWSLCRASGGGLSQAPEMLIVPDPLARSFDGPLVVASYADDDGEPQSLSFTLPPELAGAAHDEADEIVTALNDGCGVSKLDVKVTHAPAPPVPPRWEVVGGMGADGTEYAILDNGRAEHLPDRYGSREEAERVIAQMRRLRGRGGAVA